MTPAPADQPPLISIITVVRNDAAGLAATKASITAQGPVDYEWLVADGGSDDDTLSVLDQPGPRPDWLDSRPDGGPFAGMDRAMRQARGTYLLFLNAGDRLAGPGVLAALIPHMTGVGAADILYGDSIEDPGDGKPRCKPARHWRWAFYGMPAHHCAILYRRTLLAGLCFDQGYRIAGDYAVTLDALRRAQRIVQLSVIIAAFAPGGLSRRHATLGREEQKRIREIHFSFPTPIFFAITMLQTVAENLRHLSPKLYAFGRFRRYQ
ncbi:glycosyltransferase [Niveispirillum irakense]|uniref:glycosyltransferase n=1 Tax=Niveispirillum irakense TaxID=34011 RepID=UPI00042051A5|nr:glycosyltransferase [Niveispirillum irakense]